MLDYIEGLLLGRLWSDTDFENRKHVSLFILYGLLVDSASLFFFLKGRFLLGIGNFVSYQLVLLILLFLACPFINCKYYSFPWRGKLLVLIEKIYKNYLIFSLITGNIIPRLNIPTNNIRNDLIDYLNYTLEDYTTKFSASAGAFSTVIGVLAGGIHVVFYFVLNLVILIAAPALIYFLYRLLQYGYDFLMQRFVTNKIFRHK